MSLVSNSLVASLRLPKRLDGNGLLVGWSMEAERNKRPIGFTFGDPKLTPNTGYVDPILLEGDGHLITIAPTGAGKGVGAIVPALLRFPGPVIVIDPKGENAAVTARRRRELGQQVVVLDPMGVYDRKGVDPDRFDPMDLVDPESATGVDDAVMLAGALLPDSGEKRDHFWLSRARQLLTGLILHVRTDMPHQKNGLAVVRQLVNSAAGDADSLAIAMRTSRHPEVVQIADNLNIGAEETLGGIIAFAQEGVDFIRGPLVQAAMAGSTFKLDEVTRGSPLAIYLILPPAMLESHGRLLRLWISSLMAAILRRTQRPKHSTLFILDEAAQLGSLPQLRQAVTLLRGYGLQTWSFWQDVSQLMQLYPHDWQTMVNNCRVIQAFGANNLVAANAMAGLVGFGDGHAVLDLEQHEMLLQLAGDQAVVARRPDYRVDPAFAGLFDDNPFFGTGGDPVPKKVSMRRYLRSPEPEKSKPRRSTNAVDRNLIDKILGER